MRTTLIAALLAVVSVLGIAGAFTAHSTETTMACGDAPGLCPSPPGGPL